MKKSISFFLVFAILLNAVEINAAVLLNRLRACPGRLKPVNLPLNPIVSDIEQGVSYHFNKVRVKATVDILYPLKKDSSIQTQKELDAAETDVFVRILWQRFKNKLEGVQDTLRLKEVFLQLRDQWAGNFIVPVYDVSWLTPYLNRSDWQELFDQSWKEISTDYIELHFKVWQSELTIWLETKLCPIVKEQIKKIFSLPEQNLRDQTAAEMLSLLIQEHWLYNQTQDTILKDQILQWIEKEEWEKITEQYLDEHFVLAWKNFIEKIGTKYGFVKKHKKILELYPEKITTLLVKYPEIWTTLSDLGKQKYSRNILNVLFEFAYHSKNQDFRQLTRIDELVQAVQAWQITSSVQNHSLFYAALNYFYPTEGYHTDPEDYFYYSKRNFSEEYRQFDVETLFNSSHSLGQKQVVISGNQLEWKKPGNKNFMEQDLRLLQQVVKQVGERRDLKNNFTILDLEELFKGVNQDKLELFFTSFYSQYAKEKSELSKEITLPEDLQGYFDFLDWLQNLESIALEGSFEVDILQQEYDEFFRLYQIVIKQKKTQSDKVKQLKNYLVKIGILKENAEIAVVRIMQEQEPNIEKIKEILPKKRLSSKAAFSWVQQTVVQKLKSNVKEKIQQQIVVVSKPTITLNFSVWKKAKVGKISMSICTWNDHEIWENPNYFLSLFYDQEGVAHGGMEFLLVEEKGAKFLIAGLEPSSSLVAKTNYRQLYREMIVYGQELAEMLGAKFVVPFDHSVHSCRVEIQNLIQKTPYVQVANLQQSYHWGRYNSPDGEFQHYKVNRVYVFDKEYPSATIEMFEGIKSHLSIDEQDQLDMLESGVFLDAVFSQFKNLFFAMQEKIYLIAQFQTYFFRSTLDIALGVSWIMGYPQDKLLKAFDNAWEIVTRQYILAHRVSWRLAIEKWLSLQILPVVRRKMIEIFNAKTITEIKIKTAEIFVEVVAQHLLYNHHKYSALMQENLQINIIPEKIRIVLDADQFKAQNWNLVLTQVLTPLLHLQGETLLEINWIDKDPMPQTIKDKLLEFGFKSDQLFFNLFITQDQFLKQFDNQKFSFLILSANATFWHSKMPGQVVIDLEQILRESQKELVSASQILAESLRTVQSYLYQH